jgi:hypothetical protein
MKYIKNETRYDIFIRTRDLNIVLRTRTMSKDTGSIIATGYTCVADEDYAKLTELKDYERFLKSGRLSEYSENSLPDDALSESDVIASLQKKICDLEVELAQTKEDNDRLKELLSSSIEEGDNSSAEDTEQDKELLSSSIEEGDNSSAEDTE